MNTTDQSSASPTRRVLDYIRANWPRSIYRDAPGTGFAGVDIPFPYTSPCIKGEGHFSFFFYWDTYFTNLGLLRHGHAPTAKDNIKNMLWFIARQGYMPNHVGLYNRSQSPYLCRMVKEYIAATDDTAFLPEAAAGLRQEYHFWITARHSPTGLQRHGHHETAEGAAEFYCQLGERLGFSKDVPLADRIRIGGHYLAEAEASCDFTPRFESRCLDYNPVDLNSLLYEYETYLAEVSVQLGWDDTALWQARAARRRELVNRYLWNEERGLFLDYDFVNQRPSPVASLTGLVPLFTGLASPAQAARMRENLPLFEREFGVAVTEDCPFDRTYQWAFPNVWPPLVYVTVEGLRRYGFAADARRIAEKYLTTANLLFEKTGQLWEKTNAITGEVAGGEYKAAPMLGWSAGVYVALAESINT
jgi:alpha,alpha-trehalase